MDKITKIIDLIPKSTEKYRRQLDNKPAVATFSQYVESHNQELNESQKVETKPKKILICLGITLKSRVSTMLTATDHNHK